MSEASKLDELRTELQNSDPTALLEALQLVRRLASLSRSGEFENLVEVKLDSMLTTEQCAKWMQLSDKEINKKAASRIIPAIPISSVTYRFHPRTIIEAAMAKKRK